MFQMPNFQTSLINSCENMLRMQTMMTSSTNSVEKRSMTNQLKQHLKVINNHWIDQSQDQKLIAPKKHIKIKHNSTNFYSKEESLRGQQKSKKTPSNKDGIDLHQLLNQKSENGCPKIINNNISGLSINYSNHIHPA